jgi:hypothetical protein
VRQAFANDVSTSAVVNCNIAYLITAYHQPDHLARLIDALAHPAARIFVHVDRKVPIEPFRAAIANRKGVVFLDERVRVNWMGFSQVDSSLRLIRAALLARPRYCVLLTGSDYPIKCNEAIMSLYAQASEEFISFWRVADRPSWYRKVAHHYPVDVIPIRGWAKGSERSLFVRLFWGRYFAALRYLPKRRFPADLQPYGGSDWWSLSARCLEYVLTFVDSRPDVVRFFRTALCPSDMFFQTIVLNSPFARSVCGYDEYTRWSAETSTESKEREDNMLPENAFNHRHIDWSGEKSGMRERPAVLDGRDWEALERSANLFARKFESGRSDSLLDRIDAIRAEESRLWAGSRLAD